MNINTTSFSYLININNISNNYTSNSTINLYTNDYVTFIPSKQSNQYFIFSNLPNNFLINQKNGTIIGTVPSVLIKESYYIKSFYINNFNNYSWIGNINLIPKVFNNSNVNQYQYNITYNNNTFINLYIYETFQLTPQISGCYINDSLSIIDNTININDNTININDNNDGIINGYFKTSGTYFVNLEYINNIEKKNIIVQFIIFEKIFPLITNTFSCLITTNSNIAEKYPSSTIYLHSNDKIIIKPVPLINKAHDYDILSLSINTNFLNTFDYNIPYTNSIINNEFKIAYCDISGFSHIWNSFFNIIPEIITSYSVFTCLININNIYNLYPSLSTINLNKNDIITFNPIIPTKKYKILTNIPSNLSNIINNTTISCPNISATYTIKIKYDTKSWKSILNIK
jgi:hypothetical protein